MKNILFTIISVAIIGNANAQEAAGKKFQAGLVFGTGMNFSKMGTKLMDRNGAGADLLIGGNLNFMFTETIGLTTGVEVDFSTSKFKPGKSPVYYLYSDNEINPIDETEGTPIDKSGAELFELGSRKQKATLLTIPTMLIFRTNFIGYFRYFGKLGLRSSFLLSQKINDEGYNFDIENEVTGVRTEATNENMKAKNDMVFFRSSVGIAGGAEWNFTGSTCLVAEIGYYYGFVPLFYSRPNNPYLFTSGTTNGTATVALPQGVDKKFSNSATQSQLQLKISILF